MPLTASFRNTNGRWVVGQTARRRWFWMFFTQGSLLDRCVLLGGSADGHRRRSYDTMVARRLFIFTLPGWAAGQAGHFTTGRPRIGFNHWGASENVSSPRCTVSPYSAAFRAHRALRYGTIPRIFVTYAISPGRSPAGRPLLLVTVLMVSTTGITRISSTFGELFPPVLRVSWRRTHIPRRLGCRY